MRKLSVLTLCSAFAALAAYAAPVTPSTTGACRYKPGMPFSAVVQISASDKEVAAGSATVKIQTTIPAGGRIAKTGKKGQSRYIAPLDPMDVHLTTDKLKHFDLMASVIVENPDSADCEISLDTAVSSRSWAQQDTTSFTFRSDVAVEGKHTALVVSGFVSCLDQDTPILLADGSHVPIRQIVRGDRIRNPKTGAAVEVAEVIHGTQADEDMVRIGFGNNVVLFTAWHPLVTKSGIKPARAVMLGDMVRGEDGAYHAVTVREPFMGDAHRSVFNLRLKAASEEDCDHLMSAGGFVTGDFSLQNSLKASDKPNL